MKLNKGNTNEMGKQLLKIQSLILIIVLSFIVIIYSYSVIKYIVFDPKSLNFITRSTKIYDKNDILLWEISKDNAVSNTPVNLSSVPKSCIQGIIAVEDKSFYSNIGIDAKGLGRLFISIFTQGSSGGGSTISQQVIKNAFQNIYNRNTVDKFNEMIYAIKLNQFVSKDEILSMYLNNVYFGNLNYGIEAAAQDYLKKTVGELDLAECAYIVGITQWPGVYNPSGRLDTGLERQHVVLHEMYEEGYITLDERNNAVSEVLAIDFKSLEFKAPHFVNYIADDLDVKDNPPESGKIKTTYDYNLHKIVLDLAKKNVEEINIPKLNNSGVVILGKDSEILTMVGSVDYFNKDINGEFNTTLGFRQPGMAIFPLLQHLEIYPYILDLRYYPVGHMNDEITKVENSLTEFGLQRPLTDNWCTDVRKLQGCEVRLFDLTNSYKKVSQNETAGLKWIDFSGQASNSKDAIAIAYNRDYTIGIWLGNTKGEEISELNDETMIMPLLHKIEEEVSKLK